MHVRKHGDKWRVIVKDKGRIRSQVCATEREAKLAGARLMLEFGKLPDKNGRTVADLIDEHMAKSTYAKTYAEDLGYVIAKLPAWLTRWPVCDVTTKMVDDAYHALLRDGWAVSRVRRVHELLGPAFDRAALYGWIPANPVRSVKPPAKPETEIEVPSPDDVDRLIHVAADVSVDLATALHLAARTGIRRGELCGLQWADLGKDNKLHVRRSISTTTGDPLYVKTVKTGKKGNRKIPLPQQSLASLREHGIRQAAFCLEHHLPAPKWIFTHDGVNPWRADYITTALGRIADKDPDGIHVHQLRHFAATQWIAEGVKISDVSYLLGHAKVSTTMDIYVAYLPSGGQDAADAMDRILGNG